MHGSSQNLYSPHSVEVNSRSDVERLRMDHFDNTTVAGNVSNSLEVEIKPFQVLQGNESTSFDNEKQDIYGTAVLGGCDNSVRKYDQGATLQQASLLVPREAEQADIPACLEMTTCGTNILNYYSMLSVPCQVQMPQLGADSNLMIIPEHKFEIREISPEWGFANEATKVIIIGSFHCDSSEFAGAKFGDIEVPSALGKSHSVLLLAIKSHVVK